MYDAYLRFVTKDRINKIDAKREQYRTPPDSGHANPFFGLANIVKDESETWDSPPSMLQFEEQTAVSNGGAVAAIAFLIDVAGEDESASTDVGRNDISSLSNPQRDSTALTIVEIRPLHPLRRPHPGPALPRPPPNPNSVGTSSPSSKPAASKTTPPPSVILNGVKNLPLPYPLTPIPCFGNSSPPARWKSPLAPTAP